MNAIQCIKWFGLDHAKYLIKEKINSHDHEFTLDDLKRLVESVDLVKEHYTLDRAKTYAASPYTAPELKERLEQAITDYEAIGGEHV